MTTYAKDSPIADLLLTLGATKPSYNAFEANIHQTIKEEDPEYYAKKIIEFFDLDPELNDCQEAKASARVVDLVFESASPLLWMNLKPAITEIICEEFEETEGSKFIQDALNNYQYVNYNS